jgi:hypothetical protein
VGRPGLPPPSILNVPPSASVVPLLWYAKLHPAVFNAMQRSHTAVCGTKNMRLYWHFDALKIMAERVGFEPTVRFPVRSLSRRVLSTTQSPLRSGRSM